MTPDAVVMTTAEKKDAETLVLCFVLLNKCMLSVFTDG